MIPTHAQQMKTFLHIFHQCTDGAYTIYIYMQMIYLKIYLFLQLISYLLYEMHLRIEYDDDE